MKTSRLNLLFLSFAVSSAALSGQTLYVPSGTSGISSSGNANVGIGTASPADKFTVQATHGDTRFRLFSDHYGQGLDGANTALLSLWASEPGWTWTGTGIGNNIINFARVTNTRGGSYIRLLDNQVFINTVDNQGTDRSGIAVSNGNVGIGTTTPSAKLHIEEGDLLLQGGTTGTSRKIIFKTTDNSDVAKYIGTEAYWTVIGAHGNEGWKFKDNSGDVLMQINGLGANNGYVGIGTTSPTQKLSVNGAIRAKEVIVDTGWSDFVFDESYELKALSETEAFIKSEKHLPGIPSASEVAEHGVSVGEMQAKLLAKIEELTLHQIAQEKEIVALKNENAEQRHQISELASDRFELSRNLSYK